MSFGNTRHIADIKIDDMASDSQATIGLQMGSNQGASQVGETTRLNYIITEYYFLIFNFFNFKISYLGRLGHFN